MPTTVDIWLVPIPARLEPEDERRSSSVLSDEERDQLRRIGHPGRRNQYLLGHALARIELARILAVKPAQVPLVFIDGKRPMVAAAGYSGSVFPSGESALMLGGVFLSLSHSSTFVALAIASVPVGIDIEPIRQRPTPDSAAAQSFSPVEAEDYERLAGDDRALRYAQIWSLHEAMIKGSGLPNASVKTGVSFQITPLRRVSVVPNPMSEGGLGGPGDESWQASLLTPDDDQGLAVAARTPIGSGAMIPAVHRDSVSSVVATGARVAGEAGSRPVAEPVNVIRLASIRAARLGLPKTLAILRRLEGVTIERLAPLFHLRGLIALLKKNPDYADTARVIESGQVKLASVDVLLLRLALISRDRAEIGKMMAAVADQTRGAPGLPANLPAYGVGVPGLGSGGAVMQIAR